MGSREDILTAVRQHGPAARPRPEIPDFTRQLEGLVDAFASALAQLDGTVVTDPPGDLNAWLTETFPRAQRICSGVPEVSGTVTPSDFSDWAAPADIDVTIVRTPLGIGETGSILLTEDELNVDTIAVLAEHLVVLLDPSDIVENVHLAYRHPRVAQAAYAVFLSGPSGSADIGGQTVHPAQGVTTLTILLVPRRARTDSPA
jgi:L-lactate dehydrogenase complex protein LldG